MEDDLPAPKDYVVNAYLLKADFGKMRGPALDTWLASGSEIVTTKGLKASVKIFGNYIRADIKVATKEDRKSVNK